MAAVNRARAADPPSTASSDTAPHGIGRGGDHLNFYEQCASSWIGGIVRE